MLNIKTEKDGVLIEAEGTTKEIFEATATAVGGVYKQSVRNTKEDIPFSPLPVIQAAVRNELIQVISMALVEADKQLNAEYSKKDIKSADFTEDGPMSFSEFMKKLLGLEDTDEHGNKST